MVVSVVFNHKFDSKEYHYQTGGDVYHLMDEVLVPVGSYGQIEVATIVAMWDESVHPKYNCCSVMDLKTVFCRANKYILAEMMDTEIKEVRRKYEKWMARLV